MRGGLPDRTDDGFLLKSEEWDKRVGLAIAAEQNLELTDSHWEIIHLLRDYHAQFRHLPNARMFVKLVSTNFGPEKGNSRYLHGLFPGSAVRLACLIAGLPKPPGCL